MSTAPHTSPRLWAPPRPRLLHALFGLTACGAVAATYSLVLLGGGGTHQRPAAPVERPPETALTAKPTVAATTPDPVVDTTTATPEAPPTAGDFAEEFFATANAYSAQHGQAVRLGRAHCVQASRGHYMCSYESRTPGQAPQCHIIQAQWTPDAESTFTVTLSSRVTRCGSLRAALRSLR
jgi:hypothetical protein